VDVQVNDGLNGIVPGVPLPREGLNKCFFLPFFAETPDNSMYLAFINCQE